MINPVIKFFATDRCDVAVCAFLPVTFNVSFNFIV